MDQTKFNNLLSIMVFVDTTRINKLMCNPESQPYLDETLSWDQTVRDAIQSIKIKEKYIEKINSLIPGKLLKKISSPNELMKNEKIKTEYKASSLYLKKLVQMKVEYFKSIDITKIPKDIVESLVITSILKPKSVSSLVNIFENLDKTNIKIIDYRYNLPTLKLVFKTLNLNEDKIKKILDNKYNVFIEDVRKKYNPFTFIFKPIVTLEQQLQFLMNDNDDIYIKTFVLNLCRQFKTNEKLCQTFLQNLIKDLAESTFSKSIFENILLWKFEPSILLNLCKIEEENEIEFLEKNYSSEIKYDIFNLKLDDYWALFQLDPVLVKNILQERFLLDDITFCDYQYDCWDFLNSLNPQVQSNIKTKIHTDMNFQMENRYGNIATLENLVDIIIFCQTPPQFLQLNGFPELYSEARKLLTNFLKSIKWDMNKLNYLNWKLEVSYKLTQN